MRKLEYEEVKEFIYNKGFLLISNEYNGTKEKIKIKCPKNHEFSVIFGNFKTKGGYCPCCVKRSKPEIENIRLEFEKRGCVLLSKEYINNRSKLSYICSCGNKSEISWNKFWLGEKCPECRVERLMKTKNDKYGNPSFNNNAKSKQTNLIKYGYETNFSRPEIIIKAKKARYDKNITRHSKISQELFWSIYKHIGERYEKIYFAELNREFSSYGKEYFCYDFIVYDNKKCIEFHGDRFHPQDNLLDSDVGWHAFNKTLTAGKERERTKNKINFLTNNGFSLLVVWEKEYKSNKSEILRKCLNYLNEEISYE